MERIQKALEQAERQRKDQRTATPAGSSESPVVQPATFVGKEVPAIRAEHLAVSDSTPAPANPTFVWELYLSLYYQRLTFACKVILHVLSSSFSADEDIW